MQARQHALNKQWPIHELPLELHLATLWNVVHTMHQLHYQVQLVVQ